MKKARFLLVLVAVFCLTGCVKMNATMKINNDKSMDYEIITAMAKDLVQGDTKVLSDDQKKQAKKNGYKLSDYKDDEMVGYKATKHIKNIDEISTTKKVESNLDMDSKDKYMFTVKKGFFKNTYKAKLTTSTTDNLNSQMGNSNSNDNDYSYDEDEDEDLDYDYEDDEDDSSIDLGDDTDFSQYTKNMDFKFEVKLPYKAKKNNATSVEDDGKTLSWNLFEAKDDIEFEFELYNLTNIYLTIGGAVVVIALVIVFILKKKKSDK